MIGNLTGQRYGMLTVQGVAQAGADLRYTCRCDCGRHTTVLASNLRRGHTRSCGASSCRTALTLAVGSYDPRRGSYGPTRAIL
jgi:hypothetical protein